MVRYFEKCLALGFALALGGCEVVGGFEDFEAASGASGGTTSAIASGGQDTGGSAGEPGAVECPEGAEPGTAGPTMIQIPKADGTCFWMDETEVSRGDYEAFVAAGTDPSLQPAFCTWNDDFSADDCEAGATTNPSSGPGAPMTCIDQCDAAAFCAFAGKRLCSGEAGMAATDATVSEWFSACTNGDTTTYPYGDEQIADACNTSDRPDTGCTDGACVAVDVDALLTCDSDAGITDLSGNVAEWTSECNAESGEQDDCTARGGSVRSRAADAQCADLVTLDRSFADAFTGFRCCADVED